MNVRPLALLLSLGAAGSVLAVTPASAATSAATCRPGKLMAVSMKITPTQVHAGGHMTLTSSVTNCSSSTLTVRALLRIVPPKSCGPVFKSSHADTLRPHFHLASASRVLVPSCVGRWSYALGFALHGKTLTESVASFTVVK